MNLRRQLLRSFALQGAGSASVLLATLILGSQLGPEVQGSFSRSKAEIEFLAALAMLGLPQSLFFHVKSGQMGQGVALRWALFSGAFALLVGASVGLQRNSPGGLTFALVLGLAVGACVLHGQLRVLLLVRARTEWFNLFTALPQVLVLGGAVAVVAGVAGHPPAAVTWWLLFWVAFGVSAGLAWAKLRNLAIGPVEQARAPWPAIARYGLASWLAAALTTAAILFAQHWVEAREGLAALGRFTLALTLVQVPLTPVAYAAPLLFRRWMERPGASASRRWAAKLSGLLFGVALLVFSIAPLWPDLGLGEAYVGVTRAFGVLLVGGAAEAALRILAAQAVASGRPWVGVRAEAARWGVLGLAWVLPLPSGLLVICAVWAIAAVMAALVFALHARGPASRHAG